MTHSAFIIVDLDERWLPLVPALRARGLAIISVQSQWRRQADALWKGIADEERVVEDGADAEAFAEVFSHIASTAQIAGILTDQDAVVEPVARAARQQGIAFTDFEAVSICRDKGRFRQFLQSIGARSPRFQVFPAVSGLYAAALEIGFPCVVKPARGSGSRICYPLYASGQLDWYLQEHTRLSIEAPTHLNWLFERGLVCESWLDGPIVSAAIAATASGAVAISSALHFTHGENPCVGFGSISFSPSSAGQLGACVAYAIELVECLGLGVGLFDVEMVLTEAGPVALELNARPMGGEMIGSLATRVEGDLYGFIADLYLGRSPHPPALRAGVQSVVYKVVARTDGRISDGFCLQALRDLVPANAAIRTYRLAPSSRVHALEVLGRVLLTGYDVARQGERLDAGMAQLAERLGVELVTASPPFAVQLAALAR